MAKDFSKDTTTWKLYEIYFLDNIGRDAQGNYLEHLCDSRGQAINLAMGLNRCNMQWHRENGVDERSNQLTARPVQVPGSANQWKVELCEAKRHKRRGSRLDEMLQEAQMKQAQGLLVKPRSESLDPDEPGISVFEKIRRLGLQSPVESQSNAYAPEAGSPPSIHAPIAPDVKEARENDLFAQMYGIPEPIGQLPAVKVTPLQEKE